MNRATPPHIHTRVREVIPPRPPNQKLKISELKKILIIKKIYCICFVQKFKNNNYEKKNFDQRISLPNELPYRGITPIQAQGNVFISIPT